METATIKQNENVLSYFSRDGFIEKLAYFAGVIGPIMTLPQLYKIWINHTASGVSIASWSAYLLTASIWLLYAIKHQKKPLMFTYCVWILLDILIISGILVYG